MGGAGSEGVHSPDLSRTSRSVGKNIFITLEKVSDGGCDKKKECVGGNQHVSPTLKL